MGPNGSGKSTLAQTLMGHPGYAVTGGTVRFRGKDLLAMAPHERARAGLFLAFQYPGEIAGVTLRGFLFAAQKACLAGRGDSAIGSPIEFQRVLEEKMRTLAIAQAFAERFVNEGFSGGEKKKAELLQMHVLQPALALLDETDSGLDIDALKTVAEGINAMRMQNAECRMQNFSCVLVTHYARILEYVKPDRVHVMVGGRIVESGGAGRAAAAPRAGGGKGRGGGEKKMTKTKKK